VEKIILRPEKKTIRKEGRKDFDGNYITTRIKNQVSNENI